MSHANPTDNDPNFHPAVLPLHTTPHPRISRRFLGNDWGYARMIEGSHR